MKGYYLLILIFFFATSMLRGQLYRDEYIEPISDPSAQGQRFFVEDLLDIAGYVPEKIDIYQTLPNNSRVFRIKLDSINGGFVFVRWDKVKKENYVANKMIDPGVYYNLKAAKEIMRKQTDKATFSIEDVALQASDQEQINSADLKEMRAEFDLRNEEKRLEQDEILAKQRARREKREKRKKEKESD